MAIIIPHNPYWDMHEISIYFREKDYNKGREEEKELLKEGWQHPMIFEGSMDATFDFQCYLVKYIPKNPDKIAEIASSQYFMFL